MKATDLDLHLISNELCPYVQRARVVLIEKDIPHRLNFVDLAHKPQWFLDLSPLGRVPVLLVDGRPLFESAVIAEFLDEISPGSLLPGDPFERARARAWVEFASDLLSQATQFFLAQDDEHLQAAQARIEDRWTQLERALGVGPYFLGEDFSLVDAAFGPVFRYFGVIDTALELGLFRNHAALRRWQARLAERPSVKQSAPADYGERLLRFLGARDTPLARRLTDARGAALSGMGAPSP